MKTNFECPDCGKKFYINVDVTVNEKRPQDVARKKCYYIHAAYGWLTGCGKRIVYNNAMKICPYCCKQIICLDKEDSKKIINKE